MSRYRPEVTAAALNARSRGTFPGLLGLEVTVAEQDRLSMRVAVQTVMLAPNGYMHAAVVVALADTACGYGTYSHLPEGATGFTTIELKSNFLGTAREGVVVCEARPVHLGRSTHVWDAEVHHEGTGRRVALFRCSQLVLWPK